MPNKNIILNKKYFSYHPKYKEIIKVGMQRIKLDML